MAEPETVPQKVENHSGDSYTPVKSRPAQRDWLHSALPSILWAAGIATLLMLASRGAFGLGMLVGGFVAVVFYRRRNPLVRLTAGLGARLGAVTGAVSYGILLLFLAISVTLFQGGEQLREALNHAIEQAVARASDPQTQQALESFRTAQGRTILLIAALVLMLMIFVALASAGGALSGFWLKRKQLSANGGDSKQEIHHPDRTTEDHQNSFK